MHLEGESHGHPYSLDGELRIDASERRLGWAAKDGPYEGSMRVIEDGDGSRVDLHLSFPDGKIPQSDAAVAEIRRGADEVFDRLARLAKV